MDATVERSALFPAGWALRRFALDELVGLVADLRPRTLELSKDFVDGTSLKQLGHALRQLREEHTFQVVLAATTDLAGCAGFSWEEYRRYLAVQVAQARFLECAGLRLFLGAAGTGASPRTVLDRLCTLAADLAPIETLVEIHGGIESDPRWLSELLEKAPVRIVVDVEGARRAGLTPAELREVLPPDRIAYFHLRNLPGVWTDDAATLADERSWRSSHPDGDFLWEPKSLHDPRRIQECVLEYRTADRVDRTAAQRAQAVPARRDR